MKESHTGMGICRPTLHRNTFFSFFLIHLPGHGWTAGKEFQIKIPHDVGAQDIFIWNSVAVLDWRAAVAYLCRRKEEKLESHFNFLKRLGKEAGVIVKLYNDKLILFEEEIYEKKEARLTFTKEELKNYSFRTDDTDTYAGCKITYYDNYLGEKVEESFFTKQRAGYKRGTQRVLFINEEQDPPGETKGQKRAYLAKVAAKALKEKNKNAIRGNIEIIGREKLLSVGDVIEINDFGIFKGKYLINKIDIDFKTYNLKLDIRMIEEEKKWLK